MQRTLEMIVDSIHSDSELISRQLNRWRAELLNYCILLMAALATPKTFSGSHK